MATPTTLPASFTAGQVLTAAQMNNIRGAFRVLQIVDATAQTVTSTTSTTFVTANISASITPSSTSSKVLVWATFAGEQEGNATSFFTIFRGTVAGTNLGNGNAGMAAMYRAGIMVAPVSMMILDSPATTSAQTYTVGMRTDTGTLNCRSFSNNAKGSLILAEISA